MMIKGELNVIIINDFANINGGAAKVAIDTAIGLSYQLVNVYYFCAVGEVDKGLLDAPIKSIIHLDQEELLYSDNKIRALFKGIWNVSAGNRINELLNGFDKSNTIVHVHGWVKSLSVSVIAVSLRKKFPIVITLHDYFIYCPNGGFYNFPEERICYKRPLSVECILSNCDSRNYGIKLYRVCRNFLQRAIFSLYKKNVNLIALSKLSYEVLNPYLKDFKKTYLVENPIDTRKAAVVNVANNNTCVFIGRLSPEKGVTYFCEALKLLNVDNAIIIGEGTNKLELETMYPSYKFVGWQSKEQIRLILQNARLLVFPSVWYETYGLVVQEASSYGIPCIVADTCAARELINEAVDGLIFRTRDTQHLAYCMKDLLQNDDYAAILGEKAYEKFWSKDHSVKTYSLAVKNVYDQILNQ